MERWLHILHILNHLIRRKSESIAKINFLWLKLKTEIIIQVKVKSLNKENNYIDIGLYNSCTWHKCKWTFSPARVYNTRVSQWFFCIKIIASKVHIYNCSWNLMPLINISTFYAGKLFRLFLPTLTYVRVWCNRVLRLQSLILQNNAYFLLN